MKATPSPIELAMIAAPIFASYVARGRGSHEDAVNDARQLIEAAERPLGATGEDRLLSTLEAAKIIYGYQKNVPKNWRGQFEKFCEEHWEDSIAPASSSFFVATHKTGGEMYGFYNERGWDAHVVKRIHRIYRAFRTRASKHKRVKVTKC